MTKLFAIIGLGLLVAIAAASPSFAADIVCGKRDTNPYGYALTYEAPSAEANLPEELRKLAGIYGYGGGVRCFTVAISVRDSGHMSMQLLADEAPNLDASQWFFTRPLTRQGASYVASQENVTITSLDEGIIELTGPHGRKALLAKRAEQAHWNIASHTCEGAIPSVRRASTQVAPGTPEHLRAFAGSWVGYSRHPEFSSLPCVGVSISAIDRNGTVSGVYNWAPFNRPNTGEPAKAGSTPFRGAVSGKTLHTRFTEPTNRRLTLYASTDAEGPILRFRFAYPEGYQYGVLKPLPEPPVGVAEAPTAGDGSGLRPVGFSFETPTEEPRDREQEAPARKSEPKREFDFPGNNN